MSATPTPDQAEQGSRRLMVLLAMAMFVLVVDTSLMNVSISAVIEDVDTTASGVQSAIALEALVSAAFILINSKVGDLIGRKRAYVLGLLAYAIGALAMTLTQSLTAIVIFWAIIGGLGASLLLPAMQSLIHGNFTGAAQKQAYALIGAAAAIAAAVGPLLGGFVTTYLSWRVGFALEVVIIAVVLSQIRLIKDVEYTGSRQVDGIGAVLSVVGMGGVVLGILVWQEGGEFVVLLMAVGAVALVSLARWLVRRKREHRVTLLDPDLFRQPHFTTGVSGQMLQQVTLGGAMIVLPAVPADDPRVQRDAGRALAGPPVADDVRSSPGRRAEGGRPSPRRGHPRRLPPGGRRAGGHHPARPEGGQRVVPRGPPRHRRLRPGPAGVAAEQLHARADRGGADQRGGRGQLRCRVLRPVLRAGGGRRAHARRALVQLHAADREQHGHPAGPAAADRDDPGATTPRS